MGCGTRKRAGCIGVDIRKVEGVNALADASKLPFKDDSFDSVFLSHIVEHILDLVSFMKEVWRVCKNHATIYIWTPHFTSHRSYGNPTHFHYLSSQFFDHFDRRTWQGKDFWVQPEIDFEIRTKQLRFNKDKRWFWNRIIEKIANKYLAPYEAVLAWIFPANELYFELEAIKEQKR